MTFNATCAILQFIKLPQLASDPATCRVFDSSLMRAVLVCPCPSRQGNRKRPASIHQASAAPRRSLALAVGGGAPALPEDAGQDNRSAMWGDSSGFFHPRLPFGPARHAAKRPLQRIASTSRRGLGNGHESGDGRQAEHSPHEAAMQTLEAHQAPGDDNAVVQAVTHEAQRQSAALAVQDAIARLDDALRLAGRTPGTWGIVLANGDCLINQPVIENAARGLIGRGAVSVAE